MPGRHAAAPRRASSATTRRRRTAVVGAVLALLLVLVVVLVTRGGPAPAPTSTHPAVPADRRAPASGSLPAVEAGLLPWALDSPLSREVVVPGTGSTVIVVGGLDAAQQSRSRIFALDTSNGAVTEAGNLAAGVHDAAGAQLGGHNLLFGGGSPNTIADVESFPAASTPATTAVVTGQLPQPRSDGSAVRIGGTVYVVGGYNGSAADRQVLATSDGHRFSVVASLPQAVRYPAVAALGGHIYLFGGEAVGGANSGQPVDAVQMVDPGAGTATVVARLPQPLAGAAAAVLGGSIYVAGGVTPTAPATAAGASSSASATTATANILAFDASSHRVLNAGTLPQAVAYGAAQVVGNRAWLVGGEINGAPVAAVQMFTPNRAFGTAGNPGAGSPYFGAKLLVADRGNNRLLLLDDTNKIVWSYPSDYAAPPPGGFYFPDDAFFARNGTEIISNQEQNETIVIIAYPSGQLLWQYGHPGQASTSPGYLHEPDDAYLLKNGQVTVADANNCRVLFINADKTIANQIGQPSTCVHQPPTSVGQPNGDTPLLNGDVLVSEITGSWVTEYTPAGKEVWTVQLPIAYPSDPQQIGPDLYLISDYTTPGAILEFNREGQVLYRYQPGSGRGALNQPSLTELLPSGVFMTNDDYRHRMVAIDPTTQALVWQYGVTDTPGTAPGYLNTPDGFDMLEPNGTTPTHPATG